MKLYLDQYQRSDSKVCHYELVDCIVNAFRTGQIDDLRKYCLIGTDLPEEERIIEHLVFRLFNLTPEYLLIAESLKYEMVMVLIVMGFSTGIHKSHYLWGFRNSKISILNTLALRGLHPQDEANNLKVVLDKLNLERWHLHRARMTEICIGLQSLGLSALEILRIVEADDYHIEGIIMLKKWNVITLVKHFQK